MLAAGLSPKIRAATPATCGDAIEVPESATGVEKFLASADGIETPGAKISTHSPKLENDARLSNLSVAPTVIASGADAGDAVQASAREFPAATTVAIPRSTSEAMAALKERFLPPPRLMLATPATPDG